MGRKVYIKSYSDLQDQNQKVSDNIEKLKRENRRLIADNEKEKVCREMDLEKERERLKSLYQTELESELEKINQEFDKIKNDVNREKNEFKERTFRSKSFLNKLLIFRWRTNSTIRKKSFKYWRRIGFKKFWIRN